MTHKFTKTLLYSACVVALTGCPGDDDNKPKPPQNKKPIAKFTHSCNELSCSFNAQASTDPDGQITQYRWNFGDSMDGDGTVANHNYETAGTYSVKLMVTDNQNATGEQMVEITVSTKPDDPDDDDDGDDNDPVGMNECENWQSKHPDWLWCDDFESTALLTEKYGKNSVKAGKDADSLKRVENNAAHGKFSLRLKADNESKYSGSFRRNFGRVPYNSSMDDLGTKPYFDEKFNEVYYRFYVKYPKNTKGWPNQITRTFGVAGGAAQFGPQAFIATLSHGKAKESVTQGEPKLKAYSGFDPQNPDSTLKTTKWDDMDNMTLLGDDSGPDMPPVPPPPPAPPENPTVSSAAEEDPNGDDIPPPLPPGQPEPPIPPIPPPDKPDGDDNQGPLTKGKWHCVAVHLKLNSNDPYKADGVYEIAIDGKPYSKYTLSDLNWTGKWREYAINGIQFENSWADMKQSNQTTTANFAAVEKPATEELMESYLDALVISKKPINCLDTNNPDDPTPPPPPPSPDPDKPDDPVPPPPTPPTPPDNDTPPDIPPPPPPPGTPDKPDDNGDNDPPIPPGDDNDNPPGDGDDLPDDIPPPPPPPTDTVNL